MKKWLVLLLILCGASLCVAQGVRYDLPPVISPRGLPIPNIQVSLCPGTAVISGSTCGTTVQAFTDQSLNTPCTSGLPVTPPNLQAPQGVGVCSATGDSLGNVGFWLSQGSYIYCLNGPSIIGKCYTLTVPIGNGNLNNILYIDGATYAATQAGITSALTALTALGGGKMILPNQSITISSLISLPVNVPIIIEGSGQNSKLVQNFTGTTNGLFTGTGTETSTSTTLTSNANVGDTILNVTSSTGFSVGDWIEIFDTTQPCGTTGQCNFDLHRIDAIPDSSHITLKESMDSAIASGTSTVKKVLPIFATFRNFQIDSSAVFPTSSIYCNYCVDFEASGMKFIATGPNGGNPLGLGIFLLHSKHFRIVNNTFEGAPGAYASGTNYGSPVQINASSSYGVIANNTMRKIVENTIGERSHDITFSTNVIEGFSDDGINTHQAFTDFRLAIVGNVMSGVSTNTSPFSGECVAVSSPSTDILIEGNVCSNYGGPGTTGQPGIAIAGTGSPGNIQNIIIKGNIIKTPLATTANSSVGAIKAFYTRGLVIEGNLIQDLPTNGVGIDLQSDDHFVVANNTVRQTLANTGEIGIYLQDDGLGHNISNGTVTGNVVTGVHSQGFRLDSSGAGSATGITYNGNNSYSNTTNWLFAANATNIGRVNNINDTLGFLALGGIQGGAGVNFQIDSASASLPIQFGRNALSTVQFYKGDGTATVLASSTTAGFTFALGPVSNGTAAGLTGTGACATITTQTGGSWAGRATCTGTTAASTLTITPGTTAPNGWECDVQDQTTRANAIQQTSTTTTAATLTATSVTQNDVVVFKCVAF